MANLIDDLIRETKSFSSNEELVTSLVAQIKASTPPGSDLEYAVGALRTAVERHLEAQTKDVDVNRCHFCGKSRNAVRTLLVSAESTICDECVVTALHTISHQPGQFYLRMAFFMFRAVASLTAHLSAWPRRRTREEKNPY